VNNEARYTAPRSGWGHSGPCATDCDCDLARMTRQPMSTTVPVPDPPRPDAPGLQEADDVRRRLERMSAPDPSTGCVLWGGGLTNGYGSISVNGKSRRVHVVAYEQAVGPVPPGLQLDHLCRVRNCINPKHLEPVTNRENVLRGVGPTAQNARATHCYRGHELIGPNEMKRKKGWRRCRICTRDDSKKYREARILAERRAEAAETRLASIETAARAALDNGWCETGHHPEADDYFCVYRKDYDALRAALEKG
jgi:hypothetical protein